MAEVTYYYNGYGGTAQWADPDYMIDNILTNYASTDTDWDKVILNANTCPGTDLGTITKVELRAYAYGDGDDHLRLGTDTVTSPLITPGTSPSWTSYADITSEKTWTWTLIKNEHIWNVYRKAGKANTMYCAKVEIRVIYTPSGPPAKVTQYLAGNDLPEFPHEMDLLADKLPCPPPY